MGVFLDDKESHSAAKTTNTRLSDASFCSTWLVDAPGIVTRSLAQPDLYHPCLHNQTAQAGHASGNTCLSLISFHLPAMDITVTVLIFGLIIYTKNPKC